MDSKSFKLQDTLVSTSSLPRHITRSNQSPKKSPLLLQKDSSVSTLPLRKQLHRNTALPLLLEDDSLINTLSLRKQLPLSTPLPRKVYTNLQSPAHKVNANDPLSRKHSLNTLSSPKKSSPLIANSTVSLGSHLSLPESDIYASTVSIPAYYTEQKQLQKGSSISILRKLSGIPFAIAYGFILYVILRYMILSDPHQHPDFNYTGVFKQPNNLCALNFTSNQNNISYSEFILSSHFSGRHRDELVYGIGTVTVFVATTSFFSRNTRSTMLLILPGLITGRSRTFLFTFVLGLLCNGPISSIRYNFNAIMENAGCMYESALKATCHNGRQADAIFQKFEDFFNEMLILERKFEELFKGSIIGLRLNININPNITWPNFKEMIKAPQMTKFKRQITKVISQVSQILQYAHLGGKSLTCISILLLIIDAVRYIRIYYSDSSFDNMFISDRVRKLWSEKGYKVLTPLRHWELNEGYKVRNSTKFTKKEFYKSLHQLVPTLVMSLIAIMVISADNLLAETLRFVKENDELTIAFDGIQQNYTNDLHLLLPSYNISADGCLVPPVFTSENVYIIVSLILLGAGISCLLEVYLSRARAQMCNVFYPDKELERADYLHYRIHIGRINRKFQLTLIVRRELERREKLIRFSPLARLKKLISCCKKENIIVCPACGWKEKRAKAIEFSFYLGEKDVKDNICSDCYLDLKNDIVDDRMIVASKRANYGSID